jgi:carboxypeptidase Taq
MVSSSQKDFERLFEISKEIAGLKSVLELLHWDQETYMPKGGGDARSFQIAIVSSRIHKDKTGQRFKGALSKLINLKTGKLKNPRLSYAQKIALREWRKDFLKATKLPNEFVKHFSELTAKATMVWAEARKKNAFSEFLPYLEKIFEMSRKKADFLGYEDHPYDALLDEFEDGMTTKRITPLFTRLKKKLVSFLKEIQTKPRMENGFLQKQFSKEKQIAFGQNILDTLKLQRQFTRLDESDHPFTQSLHPTDTRFTTRVTDIGLMSNIFSVLHEAGHAFYEMGLPADYWGTPLCESISLGIHESQSRWWETLIGKSKAFWLYFYPLLQATFSEKLNHISFDSFYSAIHIAEPSLIRVEADELTYCLHILLRFELEKSLLDGTLKVKEIPEAWKEKMNEFLGIFPPDDARGCLQDIHWSSGLIGYFPTYALGNLYAAQFFEVFETTYPDWETRIKQGDFSFIREWLRTNIHTHGRFFSAEELCRKITKKALSEAPYMGYLKNKYGRLYGLQ